MFHFSRRAKIIFAFFVIVIGSYAAARMLGRANGGVPESFANARLQGALIAQNIVNLSNESVRDLEQINQFDREQKYTEALNLAVQTVTKSKDIRDEAVKLSTELERMTRALSEINSAEAQQAALESISNQLALLNRLINYSVYLGQLLDSLRDRFTGKFYGATIDALVNQINGEVAAINDFNAKAGEAMDRFDGIVKK